MKVPVAARRRRLPPTRKPPTPAVESARVWKAPGHHPPYLPGPSHTRWKSLPTTHHPQDFHSYAQPRRRGYIPAGGEEK